MRTGITFNRDSKFDVFLPAAMIRENNLADIFRGASIERGVRLELKSEQMKWQRSGCIAIEFRSYGKPSGISGCEAEWWAHEMLRQDGSSLGYFLLETQRVKELARKFYNLGRIKRGVGDDGAVDIVLVPIVEIFR